MPRADGDREALRILLGTRHELTVVTTAQTNRLRALLLGGGDTERDLARATLTDPVLLAMVRRREPPQASREQAVRHGEIRRLAHAVRAGRHALAANRAQLQTIVDQIAPGLTQRRGIGAVTAAQAIVSSPTPDGAEATPHSPRCQAPAHCRPAAARWFGIGSTAAATEP
jgi:transposase